MTHDNDFPSDDVVRELYPTAVSQARAQVVIEALVLVGLVALWVFTGHPRRLAWVGAGVFASGAMATAYDLRWWLWLRHAEPYEAYRRVQARKDQPDVARRYTLILLVAVLMLVEWAGPGRH